MGLKDLLKFGKEELELVVVDVEDEEKGDVVATFKSKTDRNNLAGLAKYIKELMYDEDDELKIGSYNLMSKDGKVLRRIKPKREKTADDLSKMKQEEALALLKTKRDESIQSISDLKQMQETFQKEFGLEGGGGIAEENIEVPDDVKTVWDAMKQAYAKRAYIDILSEKGTVGTTVNNMANMVVGIGTAVGEYLTAKSKEIGRKDAAAKKEEAIEKKKPEEVETKKEPERKAPELTAKVIEEGDKVLRTFAELETPAGDSFDIRELDFVPENGLEDRGSKTKDDEGGKKGEPAGDNPVLEDKEKKETKEEKEE